MNDLLELQGTVRIGPCIIILAYSNRTARACQIQQYPQNTPRCTCALNMQRPIARTSTI
jgi:hypothetical protein